MFEFTPVKLCAILLVTCNISFAILVGPSETNANGTAGEKQKTSAGEEPEAANTTFYYEANEFLKTTKEVKKSQPEVKPASISMTSARNGRMMDLDALVGDFAASKANKERSGQRQSRFVSAAGLGLPGAAAGKKLHIQGFIPIVGLKDEEEENVEASSSEHQQQQLAALAASQKLRALQNFQSLTGNELPYAQSSIGHASFGVQRYLSSEPPAVPSGFAEPLELGHQQVEAAGRPSAAANIMETLKKPIKKIARLSAPGQEQQWGQQNCLCVPFYMCKNGLIVESQLGKSQIQQLISQQQQFVQPNQPRVEMKSGPVIASQRPLLPVRSQQTDLAAYPQIDERSFEKDIITMAPLLSSAFVDQNQTVEVAVASEGGAQQELTSSLNETQIQELSSLASNGSLPEGDYSQEILGRMLGLAKVKGSGSSNALQRQQSVVGACGLLRTCCSLPPSSQQYESALRVQQPIEQQMGLVQRYQTARPQAPEAQVLYGLPSQAQISRAPLQSFPYAGDSGAPLAHRMSAMAAANTNRYLVQAAPSMVAQYSRANPMLQAPVQKPALNSFQSQQLFPAAAGRQNGHLQAPSNTLGSRKILEGRCGLRQSAGISGRVQNLQYHESSADFGEYPAQAAILKRLSGSDNLFVCAGTLISQYWVATAAHCIKKHSQSDLKVRLGEWDVHRDDEFFPYVEKEIRDVVVHPEFVAGNLVNDLALLRLDSAVDASLPHVNPACLPSLEESFAQQNCWVTGWGKDSFGKSGSFQAVLKEVELPVLGQSECERALRATRLGPHYRLHAGFLCAGGESGKDACEGDGGSGLYCVQEGLVKVAGLVSWGIGCGQPGVPGVYVNLAHFRPWIENIISLDEDIYSPLASMLGQPNSLISERNLSPPAPELASNASLPSSPTDKSLAGGTQ